MPTIGVTGHRVLAEIGKVEAGIDRALDRIEDHFPEASLTVMSALAEGADRLIAARALERPRVERLIAPLPFPEEDYAEDFRTEASLAEFRGLLKRAAEVFPVTEGGQSRDAGYAGAGSYIVSRADVLVAVWDGKPAQGLAGTGSVVRQARERGLPVAWVHAGNRRPGTMEPTSLGAEQGLVTFEGF